MLLYIIQLWYRLFPKETLKETAVYGNTIPDELDENDYVVGSILEHTPDSYVIPNGPPIRDQSASNSCCSHAVVRALEYIVPQDIEGSELYHYYNVRRYINNTFPNDTGMSIRDGCKGAQKYGISLEMIWPFNISKINSEPSQVAYWFGTVYGAKSYLRVIDVDTICEYVSKDTPVICGIHIDKSFYNLNKTNNLWSPTKKGTLGGHAVLIVGYDKKKKEFLIDNSWGKSWGKNGQFRVSFDTFQKYSFDWWVLQR